MAIDIDLEAFTNFTFLPMKNGITFGQNIGSSEGDPSIYPWLFWPQDNTSVSSSDATNKIEWLSPEQNESIHLFPNSGIQTKSLGTVSIQPIPSGE